jgi:multimeric flavodoxin WrbA
MSYVVGINGSPRKNGNTAIMLRRALEGAASKGAATELIHLNDLSFKGCVSCFACKRKGEDRSVRCIQKDDLALVLEKIEKADALIIGSPVYVGELTGMTRSFIERLAFPYVSYEQGPMTYFNRKLSVGIICTLGAPAERAKQMNYFHAAEYTAQMTKHIFGSGEVIISANTTQFDDYSKYAASRFDPEEKKRVRSEQFPKDCDQAYEMGVRFAEA